MMPKTANKRQPPRKSGRRKRKPANRLAVCVIVFLMAVLTVQILRMTVRIREAYAEEAAVVQRLEELQEINRQLQEDLDNSNDPELIENIARDQLGMVREGEKVFHTSR